MMQTSDEENDDSFYEQNNIDTTEFAVSILHARPLIYLMRLSTDMQQKYLLAWNVSIRERSLSTRNVIRSFSVAIKVSKMILLKLENCMFDFSNWLFMRSNIRI